MENLFAPCGRKTFQDMYNFVHAPSQFRMDVTPLVSFPGGRQRDVVARKAMAKTFKVTNMNFRQECWTACFC